MKTFQIYFLVFRTCGFVSRTFSETPGNVDPAFVLTLNERVQYLVPLKDGLVIGTDWPNGLAKVNWEGIRDANFEPRLPTDFTLYVLKADSEGRLFAGGEIQGMGILYRLLPSGEVDPSFTGGSRRSPRLITW